MRRSTFLIFINAMILVVVFALMAQSLFIIKRLAKAERVEGRVLVQHNGAGEFTALTRSDFIKTDDVIQTGADGEAELKWADGTRLKILSNSTLTVKKATYNMAKKADESQFQLSNGTIFVRIVKTLAPQSKFEVETPTTVAAVRGTIFMVKVANGKTEVAVHKGSVRVTSSNGGELRDSMITPGRVATSANAGQVKVCKDATTETEFAVQQSIVKPELSARITKLGDGDRALVQGYAEAGDTLTINGQDVNVLGNGAFAYRAPLNKGENTFSIECVDKHGVTNQLTQSISVP